MNNKILNGLPVFLLLCIAAGRASAYTGGDVPVGSGTLFNPEISVILDFTYGHFTDHIDEPHGFELGHSHSHGHDHGTGEGFSMREAEFTFSGALDPYFDMFTTLAVSQEGIELEEGFITSRSLPAGFGLKAGKFLSDIGYLNRQHPHSWLFIDQPWMREFLLGDEGLNELGLQLSWMPRTPFYSRFGVEVLEGSSEGVSSYVGEGDHQIVTILPVNGEEPQRNRWQADKGFDDVPGPRLFTAFAKLSPEIGYSHAMQLGLFGGYGRAFQAEDIHSTGRIETWDGTSCFGGIDLVYKYDGQGVMGHRNLVLQGEYMLREIDLTYRNRNFSDFSTLADVTPPMSQTWRQDGLYVQGVYGFAPRWNAGLRYDVLGLINRHYDGDELEKEDPSYRYTAQLTYAATEFSRFRLQAAYEAPDDGTPGWKIALQYNVSLGVHGPHSF